MILPTLDEAAHEFAESAAYYESKESSEPPPRTAFSDGFELFSGLVAVTDS